MTYHHNIYSFKVYYIGSKNIDITLYTSHTK